MKDGLSYTLRFTLIILLILFFLVVLGPDLIKGSISSGVDNRKEGNLMFLKLDYFYNETNHYKLILCIDNDTIIRNFNRKTDTYLNVLELLYKYNLLKHDILNYNIEKKDIPLELDSIKLAIVPKVIHTYDNSGDLINIKINNKVVIGEKNVSFRKTILFIIGIIVEIIGVGMCFLFYIIVRDTIKHSNIHGELPQLPNMINEGAKGWRIILGLPAGKEEKPLMPTNKEYVKYTTAGFMAKLEGIKLKKTLYENLENNDFFCLYDYKNAQISILRAKDKLYASIRTGEQTTKLGNLDTQFDGMKVDFQNIGAIINYISENEHKLFNCPPH